MKRSSILLVCSVFMLFSCSKENAVPVLSQTEVEKSGNEDSGYECGEIMVRFTDEMLDEIESDLASGKIATKSMALNGAMDELGIYSIERVFPYAGEFEDRTRRAGLHKWYEIKYSGDVNLTRADAELRSIPGVDYVEKKQKIKLDEFNDPYLGSQWGYFNKSYPGMDINVSDAWEHGAVGNESVIVAVVDGGIDLEHPDLKDNCHTDNYNFVDRSTVIYPHDHGTHVAGTIGAVNNNGIGVAGIAGGDAAQGIKGVRLMSCQIFKTGVTGSGSTYSAIKWGADHGAVICQNSWSYDYDSNNDGRLTGSELTNALNAKINILDKLAVDYFIENAGCDNDGNQLPDSPMKGGVVIFAAGNENIANGAPANYEPIIAVGAMDSNGNKASFSNYGEFVDIAAPGMNIYSTRPGSTYGNKNGTSMACPHVSGTAALVVSFCGGKGFTNEMLKDRLLKGTQKKTAAFSQIGPLVDVMGALTYNSDIVPLPVKDLSGEGRANNIDLTWTATQDANGYPAYGYLAVYGKDRRKVEDAEPGSLGEDVFSEELSSAKPAGETLKMTVRNLDFSSEYYVKVYGHSYSKQYSEPSAVITVRTGVNNPPVIEPAETPKTTFRYFETWRLPFNVSDPDGHKVTLSYSIGSKADSFRNGAIRISAPDGESGTYTGILKATDEYGASSTYEFVYTILPNRSPETVAEPENIHLSKLGDRYTMNLAQYINDEDGEDLTYTWTSSNNSVASIAVYKNTLIIGLLENGMTEVTVTATDAAGQSAEISFFVLGRDASVEYLAYPMPVKNTLNLATGDRLSEVEVQIVSQSGAAVFKTSVMASAFEPAGIDLSGLAPGRYSMTIRFDSKEFKQALIKK